MSFEEFFQKKRIDLTKLQAGEPALFFEFKTHFEQMGEKSFDHTKKYWFNKLRLLYHLSADQKPEKVHIENRLAEQTIIETLTESIPVTKVGFKPSEPKAESTKPEAVPQEEPATPKPAGFKPRFNPKMVAPKTDATEEKPSDAIPVASSSAADALETPASKPPGFKPRFNAKMVAPKPEVAEDKVDNVADTETPVEETTTPAETAAPKPAGFKPRFNPKMVTPKTDATEEKPTDAIPVASSSAADASETPASKPPGFKPRFNAKMVAPKPEVAEDKVDNVADTEIPVEETTTPAETAAPKPAGFKPRFNAKMMAPKLEVAEEPVQPDSPAAEIPTEPVVGKPLNAETPAGDEAPKTVGFKPRFNAAKMKPKPPQE